MNDKSPAQVIFGTRIIWAALLAGQVAFAVVTWATVGQSPQDDRAADIARVLLYIAIAMLATMLPVALVLRGRLINREGSEVSTRAYSSVNIVCLAICEGQTFAMLAFSMAAHQVMPFFALAAAPLAVFLAMFPRNPGWKV